MAPQVAILVSMPSIRLHWINDTRRDGLSWVNRLTSHELEHSTQARTREAWTALLDDLGLRYRFITPTQLADGTLQKQGFRALVLPRTIAISTREVENVQEFVGSGGLLIGDCQTGLYTSHLMRRPTAALDDLFGIRRRGHDVHLDGTEIVARGRNAGLPYPIAEPKIFAAGAHPRETADGVPAVLVGTPGGGQRGRTLYLNLLVMDYVKHRLHDPKRAAWLREVVGGVLQHATVRPFVRLTRADDGAQWPIAARVRKDGADVIVALHTNVFAGSTTTPWERVLGSAPMRVQITLEGTWSVTDQVTGEALGVANRFDLLLPPDTPRILRLSR